MGQPNRGGHGKPPVVQPISKGAGGKPGAAGAKNAPAPIHPKGVKGSGSK